MSLPFDLQKLPPGALEVLRDLGSMTAVEASADTIIRRTGLSERTFRKAIRRLVTRHYVAMTDRDVYSLAPGGREAVDALRMVQGDLPAAEDEDDEVIERPAVPAPSSPIASPMAAAPPATAASAASPLPPTPSAPAAPAHVEPAPPTEVYHLRRLSIFMPRELVADSPSLLRAGFDGSGADCAPLRGSGRLVLRLSAPGCTVDPPERPLDLPAHAPAGPAQFRVTPSGRGPVRLSLAVFQFNGENHLEPVGGLYVDLEASPFPTPASAEFQARGAVVRLHPDW